MYLCVYIVYTCTCACTCMNIKCIVHVYLCFFFLHVLGRLSFLVIAFKCYYIVVVLINYALNFCGQVGIP